MFSGAPSLKFVGESFYERSITQSPHMADRLCCKHSVVLNIGHADSTQGKNRTTMGNMGSFSVLTN